MISVHEYTNLKREGTPKMSDQQQGWEYLDLGWTTAQVSSLRHCPSPVVPERGERINIPNSKPKVLVVDDEPSLCHLVREVLADCCEVVEAFSGLQAIEKALHHIPDCILLDLMMPEMGGYVVCEVLKQVRRTQLIPIIIVSAKETDEARPIALESGAVDFINKPFDLDDLRHRVLDTITNQPKERRQTPRLALAVPVRIEGASPIREFRIHTLTEDISQKGLRFCSELEARVGDMIYVHILSASPDVGPQYAGKATIVWVDDHFSPLIRCGAEFVEVSPKWVVKGF